jgi:hypothetical protein
MKYYNVNCVKFGFSYEFSDFFIDNIEQYEIPKCEVNHHIKTVLLDTIEVPKGSTLYNLNNRAIFQTDSKEIVIVFSDNKPVLKIEKSNDYKEITLYLMKTMSGLAEIEYVYTGIIFMELCLYHGIQSIHGSAITCNEQAVIFSGPSGVGKSTLVSNWKRLDSSIQIINDDKPLLSINHDIQVSGSPWSGKTKMNKNITLPLHSIVFLEQGLSNQVRQLSNPEKVLFVMKNINRPRQDDLWNKTQEVLEKLIDEIPMYLASITNSIEAAMSIKEKIGV